MAAAQGGGMTAAPSLVELYVTMCRRCPGCTVVQFFAAFGVEIAVRTEWDDARPLSEPECLAIMEAIRP
jgi:hypothetical protein